ncbi:MAG: hypothetical protein BM556_06155 [Bacteriovorax sp. MedPE-SWde]|nr:MAG: hypothetical protein BM556_06155 [Bacteriovorax sp. MedPE-SWde]
MKQSFCVFGKVQAVMFRRTFCLGAKKRGFIGGATNSRADRDKVTCSLVGDRDHVERFLEELQVSEELNSWGAKVKSIELLDNFVDLKTHEVTTDNVENRSCSGDVEFYI